MKTKTETISLGGPAVSPELYEPLTDWAKEPSLEDLKQDFLMAQGPQQALVSKIKRWVRLRAAEPEKRTDPIPNRSTVRPKLVRRQNEWRYAPLSEPFLSSEELFDVSPVSWEDKESSDDNQIVLNHQMRTKLNRVSFIDNYVRTAVDEGTVIVRPGWKRESRIVQVPSPVYTYYPAQDQQQVAMIQEAIQLMQSNPQGFSELPEDLQASAEYSMEIGQPAIAVLTGEEMVDEEKVVANHPTVDILDFENVYYDPTCNGDPTKARFAIIAIDTSKAELIQDGRYKNLDKVNWSSHQPLHEPNFASHDNSHIPFKDDLRKRVVAYEYWGFHDIDGSERLTPIVATWIGHTMIRMELNPYPDQKIPLVVVPYMPVRKSIAGEPDAELLADNQEILGALTRAMIDLLGRSANGQTGFARGTLDVVNRRRFDRGQDYEFNPGQHPANAIHQHKFPELPMSALTMMQLQNQEAEALTGVKAFSGGMSGEAFGEVAAGIRGLLDAASKREMSILRRLAAGMEQLGRKIISMNQVFLSDEEWVEITNKQLKRVSRDDLAGEFNLKVDIATAEIDAAKAQDLGFMLQTMGNTLPFEMVKMILIEIARLKRMPTLVHMLENYQPTPDPLEEKRKELELVKLEAEIAEEQAKAQLSMAKARHLGSDADLKDLDFIEQETGTKHVRDMDKLSAQAKANQDLEITKRLLEPRDKESQQTDVTQALNNLNRSALLT